MTITTTVVNGVTIETVSEDQPAGVIPVIPASDGSLPSEFNIFNTGDDSIDLSPLNFLPGAPNQFTIDSTANLDVNLNSLQSVFLDGPHGQTFDVTGPSDTSVTVGNGDHLTVTDSAPSNLQLGSGDFQTGILNDSRSEITGGSGNNQTLIVESDHSFAAEGSGDNQTVILKFILASASGGSGSNDLIQFFGDDDISFGTGANQHVIGLGSSTISGIANGANDLVELNPGVGANRLEVMQTTNNAVIEGTAATDIVNFDAASTSVVKDVSLKGGGEQLTFANGQQITVEGQATLHFSDGGQPAVDPMHATAQIAAILAAHHFIG
jgi:hypothetical protein